MWHRNSTGRKSDRCVHDALCGKCVNARLKSGREVIERSPFCILFPFMSNTDRGTDRDDDSGAPGSTPARIL